MAAVKQFIKSLKKTKQKIVLNVINTPGWRTNRKLVVFESDDWGSIRMPSREIYEKLLKSGDKVDSDPFTRFDSLESEDDLSGLFDTLIKYKDFKGNHPVITANCAVANPDFDRIRASGYNEFFYEPFTETFKKYSKHQKSFELWQQGIIKKIFFPQLHCREHLNVTRWMKHLQEGKSDVITAFNNRMIGIGNSYNKLNRYAYTDAFNYNVKEELYIQNTILREGIKLFKNIFGYSTESFIFPCYIWSSELEKELAKNNIKYIQGCKTQITPKGSGGKGKLGKKRHYIGQVNKHKQIYQVRNCEFEPSWFQNKDTDWVNTCLREIETAFKWRKPATISTHRLNYIGYIDKSNRDRNLKLLSLLLSEIIKKWPNVEFITSIELGNMINIDTFVQ